MDRAGVADALDEIALLLDLLGENPFKGRAYFAVVGERGQRLNGGTARGGRMAVASSFEDDRNGFFVPERRQAVESGCWSRGAASCTGGS